ncbi:cip1-interacting zinc finger protein isoform 2-T2 [Pangshura tecta]
MDGRAAGPCSVAAPGLIRSRPAAGASLILLRFGPGAARLGSARRGAPQTMFSQQQFQLLQLQHLLQQQQQHPSQQGGRGLPPPQQQQMLNLRATNQASLLNANPMLQRALLMQQMQGNLRGFNMTAPALQQFFPQATRHSLLGPPPVGVSLKPAQLGFPGLPFQRQNRMFRKDYQRGPDKKRELDQASSSQAQGVDEKIEIPEGTQAGSEQNNSSPTDPKMPAESILDTEPAAKRLKSMEEVPMEDAAGSQEAEESSMETQADGPDSMRENTTEDASKERSFSEELKAPEVLSSGGSLKVTIQQSSESRAISTTALKPGQWTCELGTADTSPESVLKFFCYICKTNCCNQQNFQSHMAGIQHQQRLGEIQHMSNVCFVSLLPMVKEQTLMAKKDGETQQRWCNTCQIHFTGDLIKHRRTQEHKVRLGEKELGGPEDSEELITVDAVGCFEDDEEEEEEEEEGIGEEEGSEVVQAENEDPIATQVGLKEKSPVDCEGNETYCPDTPYGLDFLVPVAGYLCRLCHKFYHSDSAARVTHCKSLMHFENFQRYKAARHRATAAHVEASLCSWGSGFQSSDEQLQPPAKTEDEAETVNTRHGMGEDDTELLALKEQTSRSLENKSELGPSVRRGESPTSETDICGALVIEEEGSQAEGSKSPTTSEDCLLLDEDSAPVELLGHSMCKEEESDETRQRDGTDRPQYPVSEGDSEQEAASIREKEADTCSPAKGEAANLTPAGRRRSARRKPR